MNQGAKKKKSNEQGISLLIVLLVGTIMLMTSVAVGQYAVRMAQSLQVRSDAIQNLYTAEQAFGCVRYWLNIDFRHFSEMIVNVPVADRDALCNGTTYDFVNDTDTANDGVDPDYNESIVDGSGTGSFRLPLDPSDPDGPGVIVEVVRKDPNLQLFDGYVRVYSQGGAFGGMKNSERYQQYNYFLLYGADVMFVVDRSGSIEGDRSNPVATEEWGMMIDAVTGSIDNLRSRVPTPFIGLISFGADLNDTGQQVAGGWVPDVPLTDVESDLIDGSGMPQMRTNITATNLSLGISIAGLALMQKYYPDPLGGASAASFEQYAFNGGSFGNIPDNAGSGDRDDASFPDVMVVITDGAPNGIMTYVSSVNHATAVVNTSNKFLTPVLTPYNIGDVKIMRTPTTPPDPLIIDDRSDIVLGTWPVGASEYAKCHDVGNTRPSTVFSGNSALDDNEFPHYAMCNGTLIADKLKQEGIKIIAIYVTDESSDCDPNTPINDEEAVWLRDFVASEEDGEPLFAALCSYQDVEKSIMYLFERMRITESR